MPYKDPEKKKAFMKEWRRRSIESGYGKWLYKRRALRYSDADYFREALKEIAADYDCSHSQQIARAALDASRERWEELGPSPTGNAPTRPDETLKQALASLELE